MSQRPVTSSEIQPATPPAPRRATPSAPSVELSLVIPVYNEEENLPVLAAEIAAALAPLQTSYEVLFIDDGSNDGSPRVLAELAQADARHRTIRLTRNSGQSAALDAGFRHARGRVVITLDADLQNDPRDIPRMLKVLDPGKEGGGEAGEVDVVCGVRQNRQDDWVRRWSSRIANGVRNRLTHESITDVGCTLRVARAEFLRDLPFFTGMHRFLPTLLRLQGARVCEIPVNHRARLHGTAKYGIGNRLWRALADLFAVRWMQKRWIDRRLANEVARKDAELEDTASWGRGA